MHKLKMTLTFAVSASALLYSVPNLSAAAIMQTSSLSQDTQSFYDYWKDKYISKDPYITNDTQYFVYYSEEKYSGGKPVEVTVSEAHGYGMLITSCMAQYDSEAKDIFDGMYRFYKAHPSTIGSNLMAWQQADNGSSISNVSGADSAIDGDMDIAYSLLIADSIWGSEGEIDYKTAALNVINDIMEYEVNKTDWILQLGDWAYDLNESDNFYSATRASDFIMQYLPVFADVTGDERWLNVYNSTYNIINSFIDEYGTGILPDFIIKDKQTGKFIAAPANFLESENDGNYYYNSCRTPWRISMDYIVNQSEDAKRFADTINSFIKKSTNSDPWEIKAGYTPDGQTIEDYDDLCFTAPFLVSASCGDDEEWKAEIRDVVVNYGDDVYYGDTIKMLCLISVDGGFIVPDNEGPQLLMGDVNVDGMVRVDDIVMLAKYITTGNKPLSMEAGDMTGDGKVNIFDLCELKNLVININAKEV